MKQYSKYKNSGIDWLGNIPEHWEVKRVKEIGNVVCGATPKDNAKNWDGDIIWISPADMDDFGEIKEGARTLTADGYNSCGTTLVPEGSIILSTRAPIGKTNIAVNTLCTNQGCKCIVFDKTKVDSRYFLYRFWSCNTQFQILGKGTTFFELSTKDLSLFYLSVPPLSEQTSIASYLDEKTANIDRRIELLRNKIDNYKQLRRSLISQVVTRGLNPDVKLKYSGIEWLGDVPKPWMVKRVKDVAKIFGRIGYRGYTSDDLVPDGEGAITIGGKNITNNVLDLSNADYISWEKYYESPEIMVHQGDLVMAQRGTLGRVALVRDNISEATINPSLVLIRSLAENIDSCYLYYSLVSGNVQKQIGILNTATAVPMITQNQIENILFLFPPLSEQTAIAAYLDEKTAQIDSIIGKCEKQIEQLSALRRSLIAEAVMGKIKVC